ncbi:MAG: OmpA family protein [Bacteroidota bacterium]
MKKGKPGMMMKTKYGCLVLVLLLMGQAIPAQHRLQRKGDKYYGRLSYQLAIPYYERYLEKFPADYAVMRSLAESYRRTHNYAQAVVWYDKLYAAERWGDPEALFHHGHALLQMGDLVRARELFARFAAGVTPESGGPDQRGQAFIDVLDRYDQLMADSGTVEIEALPFNSADAEFGAYPYGEGLIFASAREEGPPVVHDFNWLDQPFLNFFYTEKRKDSVRWSKPELLKGEVNTRYHESNFTLAPDRTTFFFTRNSFYEKKKGRDPAGVIKLNLYTGQIDGLKTSAITEFAHNNDAYSVTHPAISPDGKVLFFVSDMPGGKGGKDLYRCIRQGEGWSMPMNLESLNTPGDESFPFVHPNGKLYFASDGHPGLGQLDIFAADMAGNAAPRNLGYPINTPHDDFAFYLAVNEEDGYLASNRPGGMGNDDIYRFRINRPILEIYVYDARDSSLVSEADLLIQAEGLEPEAARSTDQYGFFNMVGHYNRNYRVAVEKPPYDSARAELSTENAAGQKFFRLNIYLETPPEVISAIVVDDSTRERLPGSRIEFVNRLNRDEVRTFRTDRQGRILLNLEKDLDKNARYEVYVNRRGYFTYSVMDYDLRRAMRGDTVFPLRIDRIELDKPVLLENIHYDFDKWEILAEAYGDLEKVALICLRNPEIIVELMSHTDCRGSQYYNQKLSQKRANSARNHIIFNFGIDPERVAAVGYGESQIANECHDGIFCTEPRHRANRRTEFRVVGFIEGVDQENSVLETRERPDQPPKGGRKATKAPLRPVPDPPVAAATPQPIKQAVVPTPEPHLPQFRPGRSEELDTSDPPVDPDDWPTWEENSPVAETPPETPPAVPVPPDPSPPSSVPSDPEPRVMPPPELPNPTALVVAPRTETVPVGESEEETAPVTDLIGDSGPPKPGQPDQAHGQPVPAAIETIYRVRIGAFRGKLSPQATARLGDLEQYLFDLPSESGLNAYYIGEYFSAKKALIALEMAKQSGFFGAYLTGFAGERELSLREIRERIGG